MRPFAYLVTAILAGAVLRHWWHGDSLTTMQGVVLALGVAGNLLMYAISVLDPV